MIGHPLTYLVYAPSYNANSGGTIFLHELARTLLEMGERALLWPMPAYSTGRRVRLKRLLRPPPYLPAPGLEGAVARRADLTDRAVVVYPELVRGNPLKARKIVRWLLYKPGVLHSYEFGPDEMFFRVDEFSDLPRNHQGRARPDAVED